MTIATLPHAYPFRFLDEVSQRSDPAPEVGRARIRVTANARAAMGERWQSPLLYAEAIAQTALLLREGDAETARRGFLAGIQNLTIERLPEAGETLDVTVRLEGRFGAMRRFGGEVRGESGVRARGSVLVKEGGAE